LQENVNLEAGEAQQSVLAWMVVQRCQGVVELMVGEPEKMDLPTHLFCHANLCLEPSSNNNK
jgi:hypothetical protein